MEQFLYQTETLFSRAAKRLKEILPSYACCPITENFNWKEATAFVFGHENLQAYNRAVKHSKNQPPPLRDESLTRDLLNKRRITQIKRLTEFAAQFDVQIHHADLLIEEWQPSAERPAHKVITQQELDEAYADGLPSEIIQILQRLQITGEIPKPNELELIRKGLRSARNFQKEWIPLEIGPLAVSFINSGQEPAASTGFELLQVLAETNFTFAKVQLAQVLTHGKGCEKNLTRARSLCEYVQKALDNGEEVFVNPISYVDFMLLKADIWLLSSVHDDRLHAVQCLEKAAEKGSARAAGHLFRFYAKSKFDPTECIYSGVVEPCEKRSYDYFCFAIKYGYNPKTGKFPENTI